MKDIVRESGRLEQITDIVLGISTKEEYDWPIRCAIKDGEGISRVKTEDVRRGIKAWQKYINTDGKHVDKKDEDDLDWFSMYVESELEMRFHNYANSCAHRNTPPESDLEAIRIWEVLNSTIDYLLFGNRCVDFEDTEPEDFSIPDGWKVV